VGRLEVERLGLGRWTISEQPGGGVLGNEPDRRVRVRDGWEARTSLASIGARGQFSLDPEPPNTWNYAGIGRGVPGAWPCHAKDPLVTSSIHGSPHK
jgi:hypothetical protein